MKKVLRKSFAPASKSLLLFFSILFICLEIYGQVPQSIPFQGVARDAGGVPLANHTISVELTIHDVSASGSILYQEYFQPIVTNQLGLFTVKVGTGYVVSGNFATIPWGVNDKFLEIGYDPTGGLSFSSLGSTQMVSVPYALYAQSCATGGAGAGWLLTGNAGTTPPTNFLGTTDIDTFYIKVNDTITEALDNQLNNYSIGEYALSSATTGNENQAFGFYSLSSNTTGKFNIAVGDFALDNNTAGNNIAVGKSALYNNTSGYFNVAIGRLSLSANTTGNYNTAIGGIAQTANTGQYDPVNQGYLNSAATLRSNTTGTANTAVGASSLSANTTGNLNTAVGELALYNNSTASENTAVGTGAMYGNYTGYDNTAIGDNSLGGNGAGYLLSAIGYNSAVINDGLFNSTVVGANALVAQSNSVSIGDTTQPLMVGIGTASPLAALDVRVTAASGSIPCALFNSGNVGIETYTPTADLQVGDPSTDNGTFRYLDGNEGLGKVLTSDIYGNATWQTPSGGGGGTQSWLLTGNAGTTAGPNFLGTTDGASLMFKADNVISGLIDIQNANTSFGFSCFSNPLNGNSNNAFGYSTLYNNSTGWSNVAMGNLALYSNTTGDANTAIGGDSPLGANIGGSFNTAIGDATLHSQQYSSGNTAIGEKAGYSNITGYNLTLLGYSADVSVDGLYNATAIGYNAHVTASNSIVLGNGANVGVGTSSPSTILDITSTTQGVLLPRMTTAQRNAISSPTEGLIVYDLTLHQLAYFNGTAWVLL